jgi:hypothetical protein
MVLFSFGESINFFSPSQFDKRKTLIARLAKDIEPITNTKKKEVENE